MGRKGPPLFAMIIGCINEDWPGSTIFIICGGFSLKGKDLSHLKKQKVIAVNSSYEIVPFAQYIFAIDGRWVRDHEARLKMSNSILVTTQTQLMIPGMILLRKEKPPGLTMDRRSVKSRRTSMHGAINFSVHLGGKIIVLLGADGKNGPRGETHHHTPHPWPQRPGCWDEQKLDLMSTVKPLRDLNIKIYNTNPDSKFDFWSYKPLEDFL